MTNDGWSSKWPNSNNELPSARDTFWPKIEWPTGPAADKVFNEGPIWPLSKDTAGVPENWGNWPSKINLNTIAELKSQGSNLVDDQAYLYFQCESCNEILDPHTKSFKALEDTRFKAGWIVKWNLSGMGYKIYCAKCGEKV